MGKKTLKPDDVKKRWGNEKLEYDKFKNGDVSIKAKMAYSIILDRSLINKNVKFIREKFGSPDGFYFIDIYPAYIIQEGSKSKDETWQIVFKLDIHFNFRDIIVHKNCCEE